MKDPLKSLRPGTTFLYNCTNETLTNKYKAGATSSAYHSLKAMASGGPPEEIKKISNNLVVNARTKEVANV